MKNFFRQVGRFFRKYRKICLIVLIIVLVIALVCTLLMHKGYKTNKNSKEKTTAITAEGIVKDESYEGLKFSNFVLLKEGDMYTLTTDVTNDSGKEIDMEQVNIDVKDKSGNVIVTLLGYIGDPLKDGDTTTITASTSVDLSKASSKTISARE